jgi:hypothetical protein
MVRSHAAGGWRGYITWAIRSLWKGTLRRCAAGTWLSLTHALIHLGLPVRCLPWLFCWCPRPSDGLWLLLLLLTWSRRADDGSRLLVCTAAAFWALCACKFVKVDVPAMPAAANRASMPPPGGGMMGVSGGGGDPRCAFTVDVEAVELKRLMPPGFGMLSACGTGWLELEDAPAPVFALGGGQYCWWYSGNGFASVLPCLCGGLANSPSSLSGVSGPGESGSGLGAVPRRSASLEGWIDPSWFLPPYPPTLGLLGSCASKRARCPGERGAGAVAFELRLRPSGCGGVAFLAGRSRSLRGVYRPWLKLGKRGHRRRAREGRRLARVARRVCSGRGAL